MRIHTVTLQTADLYDAASVARVSFDRMTQHGSRRASHAFEVKLFGSSPYRPNFSSGSDDYAATWDEWGIFLAHLFTQDPHATCTYYESAEHFHWATGGRFRTLQHADQHRRHGWEFSQPGESICKADDCTAVRRWLIGRTFAEMMGA